LPRAHWLGMWPRRRMEAVEAEKAQSYEQVQPLRPLMGLYSTRDISK
jgi:hypothetical protein